jgi:hypothetical protein
MLAAKPHSSSLMPLVQTELSLPNFYILFHVFLRAEEFAKPLQVGILFHVQPTDLTIRCAACLFCHISTSAYMIFIYKDSCATQCSPHLVNCTGKFSIISHCLREFCIFCIALLKNCIKVLGDVETFSSYVVKNSNV